MNDHELLKNIDPKIHEKYSKNLYSFIKRNKGMNNFFRNKDGVIYVGSSVDEEGFLIAASLSCVLCGVGTRSIFCYFVHGLWREDKNLMEEYVKIGKCAFEPKHDGPISNSSSNHESRFKYISKTVRVCEWCGCKMKLKKWTEKINRSKWVSS